MEKSRQYLVKTADGREIGPIDQEAVLKLAVAGSITPDDMVRSVFVPDWQRASSVTFLRDVLRPREEVKLMKKYNGIWSRLKRRLFLETYVGGFETGLVKVNLESFPSAGPFRRFWAFVIDAVIIVLGAMAIFSAGYLMLRWKIMSPQIAAYIIWPFVWLWYLLYYTICMSFFTQTVGQYFWGIFLIRKNGRPFYSGRAFFYSLFLFFLWWLSPVALMLCGRTWQEILSGTRVVNVKVSGVRE